MTTFTKIAVLTGLILLALPMAADPADTTADQEPNVVFGYDTFDDIRLAINHQTGTDAAVYSSDVIVDADEVDASDFRSELDWDPWPWASDWTMSEPELTESFYVNDSWQPDDRWSFEVEGSAESATDTDD